MKKTVLFIHSAGPQGKEQGSSKLSGYLQNKLGNDYHLVFPEMPDPENPKYIHWKDKLSEELNRLDGELVLIGHSLGGSTLFKYLSEESCRLTISGLFIIASPYWGLDDDWQLKDFILKDNFEQKLHEISSLFLYHSLEEEIVPFSHHIAYAEKFPRANLRQLKGNQHLFNNGLSELVNDIERL